MRRPGLSRCTQMIAGAAAVVVSPFASAMWMSPENVPVGRILANVSKYTHEHPEDAQGYYVLGRAHGLAYTLKAREISVWPNRVTANGLPEISTDDFQFPRDRSAKPSDPPPTQEELIAHATDSVTNFEKAIKLDSKPAHYHLGLAFVLDSAADHAGEAAVLPTPVGSTGAMTEKQGAEIEQLITDLADAKEDVRNKARERLLARLNHAAPLLFKHRDDAKESVKSSVRDLLASYWRRVAAEHYFLAFDAAFSKDSQINEQPMRGLQTLVSYESGKAFIRLTKALGLESSYKTRLAKAEAGIKKLEGLPPCGAITPIVFSIGRSAPLADLLAPDHPVSFDLDGEGRAEPWPWVKPDTGLLAWDPEGTGRITSGRQLFGSVTWWMFFTDGYHALDALDDNRDGWLTGDELKGLSVWFDRNGNAVSEPGEVIPVSRLGVRALSTRATRTDSAGPSNATGLRMQDGRVLPTYDWVTEPWCGTTIANAR